MGGLPDKALDTLVTAMAIVVDYPDDPLRTFPAAGPYIRRAEFGDAGLVTYRIDDARQIVTATDVTWMG